MGLSISRRLLQPAETGVGRARATILLLGDKDESRWGWLRCSAAVEQQAAARHCQLWFNEWRAVMTNAIMGQMYCAL